MPLPDGATEIFADVIRLSVLDANGFVAVGAPTWTTEALIKATLTPVMESGDDIFIKNAAGDGTARFRHGDMAKYMTINLDLSRPDVNFEQAIAGGTVLNDSATIAVTTPVAPTPTPGTAGVLASGTYSFRVSAYNQYGETLCCVSTSTGAITGPTGSVSLSIPATTGAVGFKIYFGATGQEQFIARVRAAAAGATTYVITGSLTASGAIPLSNTTAGPGAGVGYQAPPMGIVGNTNGVSVELWGKAVKNGVQATYLPYHWWAIPMCKNMHQMPRTFQNALLENSYEGQSFENPNWGTGPFGEWTQDSTKVHQRIRCGVDIVPAASLTSTLATV